MDNNKRFLKFQFITVKLVDTSDTSEQWDVILFSLKKIEKPTNESRKFLQLPVKFLKLPVKEGRNFETKKPENSEKNRKGISWKKKCKSFLKRRGKIL